MMFRDHRKPTAATAAFDQACQEMGGTLQGVEGVCAGAAGFLRPGRFTLTGFDRIPEILPDNPQIRHVLKNPFRFRIEAGDALPAARIFDVAQAVPDQSANIEFVVEDAGATFTVAIDR
ncbi:hypothetical protein GFGA_1c1505 [Gluconobacter frateurii NBRC 103465]|nr:hypothetical protein GFGA_1c1505 [Gluconobacter frateurii NBRC 103465]